MKNDYNKLSDQELFKCICNKDESALDYIFKTYFNMILKYVLKNSGNEDDAYDVYSQAILVFWNKSISGKLILTTKVSTYIYGVSSNIWLKELNRRKRYIFVENDNNMPEPINDELIVNNVLLNSYISKLTDSQKAIIKCFYYDNLTMIETAKKLKFKSKDTAKTKNWKTKKTLQNLICDKHSKDDFYL